MGVIVRDGRPRRVRIICRYVCGVDQAQSVGGGCDEQSGIQRLQRCRVIRGRLRQQQPQIQRRQLNLGSGDIGGQQCGLRGFTREVVRAVKITQPRHIIQSQSRVESTHLQAAKRHREDKQTIATIGRHGCILLGKGIHGKRNRPGQGVWTRAILHNVITVQNIVNIRRILNLVQRGGGDAKISLNHQIGGGERTSRRIIAFRQGPCETFRLFKPHLLHEQVQCLGLDIRQKQRLRLIIVMLRVIRKLRKAAAVTVHIGEAVHDGEGAVRVAGTRRAEEVQKIGVIGVIVCVHIAPVSLADIFRCADVPQKHRAARVNLAALINVSSVVITDDRRLPRITSISNRPEQCKAPGGLHTGHKKNNP